MQHLLPLLLLLALAGTSGCGKPKAGALKSVQARAEQGEAVAEHTLGVMYANAIEVERDYTQAARWFRAAADQGLAIAQYDLAVLYDNGRGLEVNRTEAAAWYRKAALQGNAYAQYNLAVLLGTGDGVPRDPVECFVWLSLARPSVPLAEQDTLKVAKTLTAEQLATAQARIQLLSSTVPAHFRRDRDAVDLQPARAR